MWILIVLAVYLVWAAYMFYDMRHPWASRVFLGLTLVGVVTALAVAVFSPVVTILISFRAGTLVLAGVMLVAYVIGWVILKIGGK